MDQSYIHQLLADHDYETLRKAGAANLLRVQSVRLEAELAADREACKSFSEFIKRAWHVVEPSNPYVHGWHIDALCDHLVAVSNGDILRLLINVPPGTAKSLIVSVLWPSWEWGPGGKATLRYLSTSYSASYVARDSRRMRDLVSSDWYQQRWPEVQLLRFGEVSFENSQTGFREGVPFARLTGGRGHRVLIDDPHSTEMAESEAERETTTRIFTESVPSRLVEPATSAIVIIMQRLHVSDVAGIALGFKLEPYVHLMLPMEFEPDRRCTTKIGFSDPRTEAGELLFPQRFPRKVVDRDKAIMGSFATAGQFQQRPTLREGGMFKRQWFKTIPQAPQMIRWVRYWDLAASKDQVGTQAAYTVGLKLGRLPSGKFVIGDIYRARAEGQGVRRMMRETAREDGALVEIGIPQDPGQAGKAQAHDMVLMLAGYIVSAVRESGDKVTRAEPVAAQAEAGNIVLVEGDWNEAFLEEVNDFPGGKFKDQVDALSGAFAKLIGENMFSVSEEQISIDPIRISPLWPRIAGLYMDHGVVTTIWAAHDRAGDNVYIYDMVQYPRMDIAIHASAIRTRGAWIPVAFDMEACDREKEEGMRLATAFQDQLIDINTLKSDPESGMDMLSTRAHVGAFRVFSSIPEWFAAYRRVHRNEKHEIAGDETGIMHVTGLILNALAIATTESRSKMTFEKELAAQSAGGNPTTGY